MRLRLATPLFAIIAILGLAVPALAKEGATTKLDTLPANWAHAGQTYAVGYTIRMDGIEPYKADRTEIIATSLDGKTALSFPGVGDATPGHYTAQVLFPSAGTYRWSVTQGSYFAPYDLGTLTVLPAVASAPNAAPAAPASDPLPAILSIAAIAAAIFAGLTLMRGQRRRLSPAR